MNKIKLIGSIIGGLATGNYVYSKRNRQYFIYTNPKITITYDKETPKTGKPESSKHRNFSEKPVGALG